jgi:aminopeptidase N
VSAERDEELIEAILGNVQAAIARYVPDERREALAHRLSEVAWEALNGAPTGDLQIIWARALIALAISGEDIERCGRLADGDLSVEGLTVDQDMRWDIAIRYVAYGLAGGRERLGTERERDPSDRGQRAALRGQVSEPDAETKAEAWRRFHEQGEQAYGSLHLTAAAMSGFHWWTQRDLLDPYVERFFEQLPEVFEQRDHEFARTYFGALFPGHRVERAVLERGERLLAEVGDRLPLLTRTLREANDDLERAIKCRAFARS